MVMNNAIGQNLDEWIDLGDNDDNEGDAMAMPIGFQEALMDMMQEQPQPPQGQPLQVLPAPILPEQIHQLIQRRAHSSRNSPRANSRSTLSATLPPCICEAVEEFFTSLISCYSHFVFLSEDSPDDTSPSARLLTASSRLRASLLCTRKRALQALSAAATTLRTLRHTIAYTLISWERVGNSAN